MESKEDAIAIMPSDEPSVDIVVVMQSSTLDFDF